ncbi:MAG: dephospho-CoA kinase [Bacteroidia bacterium]|nr:MAG: dephospho-CoA kinase [Bacteroidia bacterium]
MLKIGLTGGIGSGKSMVCAIFSKLGVPIYNADKEAKKLTNSHPKIIKQLSDAFGADIYQASGMLNKQKLSQHIFTDKNALASVNAIIHPIVIEDFTEWVKHQTEATYIIKEAAILFESGTHAEMDKIITVISPLELRISRVMKRDNLERKKVLERIENQISDEEKIQFSDYVIINNEHQALIPQILKIHKTLAKNG